MASECSTASELSELNARKLAATMEDQRKPLTTASGAAVVDGGAQNTAVAVGGAVEPSAVGVQNCADDHTTVWFVLGGPGAGKGTQCARLVDHLGVTHLSAGELIRECRDASDSAESAEIEALLSAGKMVPSELTVRLLLAAIGREPTTSQCGVSRTVVIDGFPRSADNLAAWEAAAGANLRVAGVLCYDVDEAELSRRIVRRGSTSGRSDDQLHVLRQRFAVYREATLPVVDHYAACGKLWRINGARGVDAVWADTRRCLEEGGAKAAVAPCKVEGASPRRALGVLA